MRVKSKIIFAFLQLLAGSYASGQTCFTALLLSGSALYEQQDAAAKARQEAIIHRYLDEGAYKYHYTLQGWEDNINRALQEDSTIALLWQRKAVPYWKTGKYELALAAYDKAVRYDRSSYLARRGFLKCIFQKNYGSALEDLETAEREFGYDYQNDHSWRFYMALCHLQLHHFRQAESILMADFDKTIQSRGEQWVHPGTVLYGYYPV